MRVVPKRVGVSYLPQEDEVTSSLKTSSADIDTALTIAIFSSDKDSYDE